MNEREREREKMCICKIYSPKEDQISDKNNILKTG
jgi:hypothetical protein